MPLDKRVSHRLRIEQWKFDYSFSVGDRKFDSGAYSDHRQLEFRVRIEEPDIRAKAGMVRLFASDSLTGAHKEPKHKFSVPGASAPDTVKPVGRLWYRGDSYESVLFMPGDMLSPVLTMLVAKRYRYILLEADKGGNETAVYDFTLAEAGEDLDLRDLADEL